jgi:hypothetical protein
MRWDNTVMVVNIILVLQNCMDLVKAEPGSCSKTWLTSSHDENLVIDMKVEEDTDEEEEYPVSMVFAAVKSENEVCSV